MHTSLPAKFVTIQIEVRRLSKNKRNWNRKKTFLERTLTALKGNTSQLLHSTAVQNLQQRANVIAT